MDLTSAASPASRRQFAASNVIGIEPAIDEHHLNLADKAFGWLVGLVTGVVAVVAWLWRGGRAQGRAESELRAALNSLAAEQTRAARQIDELRDEVRSLFDRLTARVDALHDGR